MDGFGIGLVVVILSGTMAIVTAADGGDVFEWRGKRVVDDCPAAILGGCREPAAPVVFHGAKAR